MDIQHPYMRIFLSESMMKKSLETITSYIRLRRQYSPDAMHIRLYAYINAYRLMTDGPSVNPMDYMFVTQGIFGLYEKPGFNLFMWLHARDIYIPTNMIIRLMVRTTYALYEPTMAGNSEGVERATKRISRLHKFIDSFIETIPKQHETAVRHLTYQLVDKNSLKSRMERLMVEQEKEK